MPVVAFLGIAGFLAVAFTTALAGAAIYVILNGGQNVDDVFRLVLEPLLGLPQNVLLIGGVVIAWMVASVPGFLLMMNSLNTENQMEELAQGKASKKELAEITKVLKELQQTNRQTNELLRSMQR